MRLNLTKTQWLKRMQSRGKRSFSKRIRTETVEKLTSPDSLRFLSDDPSIPEELARPNGNDVHSWARQEGIVDKPKGQSRLFAIVRNADKKRLKHWSKKEGIDIGEGIDITHLGYACCKAYEIKGDGSSLPFRNDGWLVELWHSIPIQKLSS